jgi:hypothetical protein
MPDREMLKRGGIVVAFPFVYEGTQKHNAILDALSAAVLATMGWLIS